MLIEQSVEVRDAIITAFLDSFCRDGSREPEISDVLAYRPALRKERRPE